MSENSYTTIKVCETNSDSLKIVYNQYQVENAESLAKIKQSINYLPDTIQISKEVIKTWSENNQIIDIHW